MVTKKTTQSLRQELEEIFQWFETQELDVDMAIDKYKRGAEIIVELKQKLELAKNSIKKVGQK